MFPLTVNWKAYLYLFRTLTLGLNELSVRVWELAFANTPVTAAPPTPLPQFNAELVDADDETCVRTYEG